MKKRILTLVSLALALAFVFASFGPASAAFVTDTTYTIGNQGINVPAGFNPDLLYIERTAKSGPVHFTRNPINVVKETDQGFMPFTYAFFDLKKWEARAWRDGELNIWHQSESTGFWDTCNGFQVGALALDREAGVTPEGFSEATGGHVRIACVVTEPGVYGIGSPDMRISPGYGVGG